MIVSRRRLVGLALAFGGLALAAIVAKELIMSTRVESKKDEGRRNRLASEKSPYLLQHADNPVDWYPWGPEAFEKARKEDKPIFLSIGYSTCHWCHVMEHESFEDGEVAKLMNETFVNIKVDREERPDIDKVYMTVCQMMTGSGGWPLTIIMTPQKKPFFAGTYIPKHSRFGRRGMMELIPAIKERWAGQREELLALSDRVGQALQGLAQEQAGEQLDESVLQAAYGQLSGRFDSQHGGFGEAPKFPTPHNLSFLLRYWKRSGDRRALEMVEKTLRSMRAGGIYDHIGYGFHRYSTDSRWLVPHFEKMLYDQALLAIAYVEAYQATGKEDYAGTAREIFAYVLREMTGPEGGFYSAEDADSEGEEGKFSLWTEPQVRQVLQDSEAELALRVFNVQGQGNFAEEAGGRRSGRNILHLSKTLDELAPEMKVSKAKLEERLEAIRQKLFVEREKRIHPYKDDKILADWNGLMIAALAKGARVLDEPRYAEEAGRAVDFILKKMRTNKGRLLHRYRDGQAAVEAHLDDYAFMVWGLLELYESTFEVGYLQTALELNEQMLADFWDEKNGGLYFTAEHGEELLVRQKDSYDGAVPSGNSVAMGNLLRLGRITANAELESKAARIGAVFANNVRQIPSAHTQMMLAVDLAVGPSYELVIAGKPQAPDTKEMLRALRTVFVPNKVVVLRDTSQESPAIIKLAKYTESQTAMDGKATAYVCQNYQCQLPTTDPAKMLELLKAK